MGSSGPQVGSGRAGELGLACQRPGPEGRLAGRTSGLGGRTPAACTCAQQHFPLPVSMGRAGGLTDRWGSSQSRWQRARACHHPCLPCARRHAWDCDAPAGPHAPGGERPGVQRWQAPAIQGCEAAGAGCAGAAVGTPLCRPKARVARVCTQLSQWWPRLESRCAAPCCRK